MIIVTLSFTVQIASNSPAFRGFAIQARESTPSFSSSAAFVGEFVNPPPGANWEIWNCAAVSQHLIMCAMIIVQNLHGTGILIPKQMK